MTKQKLWVWGAIVIAMMLIVWVIFVSSKQIERNRRIQAEVSALEIEAAKIRRENETLAEKINYYASSDFREQEAKRKLGLKKAEETVVVIKPAPEYKREDSDRVSETEGVSSAGSSEDVPHYKKWWQLFF